MDERHLGENPKERSVSAWRVGWRSRLGAQRVSHALGPHPTAHSHRHHHESIAPAATLRSTYKRTYTCPSDNPEYLPRPCMIYAAQFSKDCTPPVVSEQDVRTWSAAGKTCLRKLRMNLLAWSQLVAVAITRSRPDFLPGRKSLQAGGSPDPSDLRQVFQRMGSEAASAEAVSWQYAWLLFCGRG